MPKRARSLLPPKRSVNDDKPRRSRSCEQLTRRESQPQNTHKRQWDEAFFEDSGMQL